MAIAVRQAEITWDGTLARGTGTLSTRSGALDQLPVTWASRTEQPDGKTSPEELISAAHSSCFAMALALVLGEAESPPEHLAVAAVCTLDEVDGAPRIATIELSVRARVAGLDASAFERHVAAASDLCPVSNALRPGVKISVHGELEPS
ncbi:MAG: OsmC family peroxiredoxin [Solirubrobacterales bacterium]|nr:OsmC family peroxiredoxin [Solirubrobacterales bacterium]